METNLLIKDENIYKHALFYYREDQQLGNYDKNDKLKFLILY